MKTHVGNSEELELLLKRFHFIHHKYLITTIWALYVESENLSGIPIVRKLDYLFFIIVEYEKFFGLFIKNFCVYIHINSGVENFKLVFQ